MHGNSNPVPNFPCPVILHLMEPTCLKEIEYSGEAATDRARSRTVLTVAPLTTSKWTPQKGRGRWGLIRICADNSMAAATIKLRSVKLAATI